MFALSLEILIGNCYMFTLNIKQAKGLANGMFASIVDVIINPNTPMKANTDNEQISHNQENEEVQNTVIKDNNDNNLSDIKIERINTNSDQNSCNKNYNELPDINENNTIKFQRLEDLNINFNPIENND